MSIESASRKGLAVFLIISAALLGSAVLDEVNYRQQHERFSKAIEKKFIEQSLKLGAWVMDRECVAEYIGLDVTTLPSYRRTDGAVLELASGIECSQ
jgi:hypothetical protein